MELHHLKNAWNDFDISEKKKSEIQSMLKGSKELKRSRKQLLFEIIAWCTFLLLYYTAFDGHRKPVIANIVLIAGTSLTIFFHIQGYFLSKRFVYGSTLKESLINYFYKLRLYTLLSIGFRMLFISGILYYFSYNISFDVKKSLSILIIALVFFFQMLFLYRLWIARLRQLKNTVSGFK